MDEKTKQRIEYLRQQIRQECISYGEIQDLVSLKEFIDEDDFELMQWIETENNVKRYAIITKEMIEEWIGSDNFKEEAIDIIYQIAIGEYKPEVLRDNILSYDY